MSEKVIRNVTGNNIRNALAAVRREHGWRLEDSRETLRSGGEDNLWRVHLSNGAIVEITLQHGASVEVPE